MSSDGQPTHCYTSCCRSLIVMGFSFLFTFTIYKVTTKDPRLYLSKIQGTSPGDNVPPALSCQIEIKNRARFLGIYYDDLHISVAYPPGGPNVSSVIPAFYQGFHKRAFKDAALLGAPWVAAKATAANGSLVPLRVEIDTRFRLKAFIIYKSKRYGLSVGEDVLVNADGSIVVPDRLLSNSAAPPGCRTGATGCLAGTMGAVLAVLSLM